MVVVDDDLALQNDDVLSVAVAVKVERNLFRSFAKVVEAVRVGPTVLTSRPLATVLPGRSPGKRKR